MLQVEEKKRENISEPQSLNPELSRSFIKFCEKMGTVFEIRDFLITLKAHIPKKFKTGELFLFYNSDQFDRRRAYVKNSVFYEKEVKKAWSDIPKIQLSSPLQNAYMAEESGRPFSTGLLVPLSNPKTAGFPFLFVETRTSEHIWKNLADFFEQRTPILNLAFKRAYSNTGFKRISYLWSQLFIHWGEPLAILQNSKILRCNQAFKQNLSPRLIHEKKQNIIQTSEKIYQLNYYPVSSIPSSSPIEILYCQDMTKSFHLKEQLFQSEKMSSLSRLGKNMAHQLNNPLTGVQSMVQILSQHRDLDPFKEELGEIEKALKRSQKIIENLLSFSQPEKRRESCHLNQIVEDTLPLLKSMTQNLQLKVRLTEKNPKIRGDLSMLQQALYNLILNSCQALKTNPPEKKALIEVSTKILPENRAVLKIKDNGPGIAPHLLEKIFQALWTSKTKGEGTGFGLSISRKIARQFGGNIFVSSKEKEGACFTIELPLYTEKT